MTARGKVMAYLIMERTFESPLSISAESEKEKRLNSCMEKYDVRWVHSYLSTSKMRRICVFEAPDAEAVRVAFRMAGLPFERVWPAELVTPEAETEPQT